MKLPRISPTEHTGRRLHRHHTSYAALTFLILAAGVALSAFTWSAYAGPPNPQSDSFTISAAVSYTTPPPPTITIPVTGQHFSTIPITVSGTCVSGLNVVLFKNGVQTGSTVCNNGGYSLLIDLLRGSNELVARQYNPINQVSGDSNHVIVTYEPLTTTPGQISQLILRSDTAYKGAAPGDKITWPAEILGGKGPYAISWDWGDGTVELLSLSDPGVFSVSHAYEKSGTYKIVVKGTDNSNQQAFLQLTALISGGVGAATTRHSIIDGGLLLIAWPLFALLVVMLLSFWLGERYEKWHLEHDAENTPTDVTPPTYPAIKGSGTG